MLNNPGKDLHIITLNIPYPADYGGIIDSFHRIRSLHNIGIQIHLHCFEYGREHSDFLESMCKSVEYYPRKNSFIKYISRLPFTVASRVSDQLLKNLKKDNFPILFDGLHTTFYLDNPELSDRKKIVRVHNIEHCYYKTLAEFERNPVKKLYYLSEALKLKKYEKILKNADYILTVSQSDQEYFERKYHNAELVPSFHPFDKISIMEGTGEYIIFHGDLSVNENSDVAEFLISEVFSKLKFKCIIAGKNPPDYLKKLSSNYNNITLLPNPGSDLMSKLISEAHINLLFAKAANGLKLKLLISLFSGRHCIANRNITHGTTLSPVCHLADSPAAIIEKIHFLIQKPFTREMIGERSRFLSSYTNDYNCRRIEKLIFPD